jgi:adenosylcobinamide-phosphate synthase
MGTVIAKFERCLFQGNKTGQLFNGIIGPLLAIGIFTVPALVFQLLGYDIATTHVVLLLIYIALSAYVLKASFTVFTLKKEALHVADLVSTDIELARFDLRALVSRDTSQLTQNSILSGICESVGENTIDSVVAPLLFFAAFGITGAICYRTVNTLDSMLGYTDHRKYVGRFSARLDDILNYVPARLSIVPILLGFCCVSGKTASQEAWTTLKRDRHNKQAVNSGIPLALYAGGLGVKFKKPSAYEIGHQRNIISKAAVNGAIRVMLYTSFFTIVFVVMVLYVRSVAQ